MGLPELKHKIQLQLEQADERLLRIVSSVFDSYLNDVVAYDAKGKQLSLDEYNQRVEQGIEDINQNRIISQDDLAVKMKKWSNAKRSV